MEYGLFKAAITNAKNYVSEFSDKDMLSIKQSKKDKMKEVISEVRENLKFVGSNCGIDIKEARQSLVDAEDGVDDVETGVIKSIKDKISDADYYVEKPFDECAKAEKK